jgi:hypothetical protein
MSRQVAGRFSLSVLRLTGGLVLCAALWLVARQACAQEVIVARPYWYVVDQRLSYALACRTLAEARKINAEAYSLELDNWKKEVDVYWDRRRRWEEEYKRLHPDEWAVEKKRQERMYELVMEQHDRVLRGDVTRTVNWLQQEMSNSVMSFQYISGKNAAPTDVDCKLTPEDLKRIQLTDGGRNGGKLHFSAGEENVLLPEWPVLLLAPAFDDARSNYESTQKAVAAEVKKNRKFSYQNRADLINATEKFYDAMNGYYTKDKIQDTRVSVEYSKVKRTVDMLAGNAIRAATLNDTSVFDGRLSFKGDSLFGLLQHMYRNGLEFDKPKPGGEGTYKRLFENLRQIYIKIGQDAPAPHGQKAAEAK